MKIGIDIDGVLADVLNSWVKEMNLHFKQNKKREDIIAYQFEKVYQVPWAEMDKFFRTNQELLLSNLAPIEKAKETMQKINQVHEIILITARPEEYKKLTVNWLKTHEIPHDKVIFTDFRDKTQYCIKEKVNFFIEDSFENALSISQAGIPVLLFDAPYNQGELPELISRVYNWDEIYRSIFNDDY